MDLLQGPLMSLLSKQDAQIQVELTLLLEGLITDHQVFRSFGYENFLEQGYLSYNLWKAFQSFNASLIIDRLDNAFHAMNGDEDDVHLDQRAGGDFQNDVLDPHTLSMRSHLSLNQAARSGDVARVKDSLADGGDPNAHDSLRHYSMTVALVEAIRHSQRDIVDLLISQGANVDGQNVDTSLSPLIAALEGENTYAISKLLSHMADLKILGQVQDAYCWRFATYLIMNHVSDFIEITNSPNTVIIRISDFRVNVSHVAKLTDRSKDALANFRRKPSSENYGILPRVRM